MRSFSSRMASLSVAFSSRRCWKVSAGVRGQPRTNERRFGVAKPNSEASQMYCYHSSYCSRVMSFSTQ